MNAASTRPARILRMRRLMLWCLPLLLLTLLGAGRLAILQAHNEAGLEAYGAGEFTTAAGEFAENRSSIVQRWIAPFNEGVARHREGDLATAMQRYQVALTSVPRAEECSVRMNLALAHEATGDELASAGDHDGARRSWQAGRDSLAAGNCPTDAGRGPEQSRVAKGMDDRLADKLSEEADPTRSPTPTPSQGEPSSAPPEPDQEQLDELDRLNEEGRDTRRRNGELRDGGGIGGDGGYHW